MTQALYNNIGKTYDCTRKADPGIVRRLLANLEPKVNGQYLDIACGSGNYTAAFHQSGLVIEGIDISSLMLEKAQSKYPEINWHLGDARNLPFADNSFDGATCILATHHIKDLDAAFGECYRVMRPGNLVLFTSTPEQMNFWLKEYFPHLIADSAQAMASFERLKNALTQVGFKNIRQEKFFVSNDLQDWFLHAGKYRPEIYLDERVRAGISSFQLSNHDDEIKQGLAQLKADIISGKIQSIIEQYETDLGEYCLVKGEKFND